MSPRTIAIGGVLAVLGLAAAVGIGLAANAISDDSVGLSAQPLSAGDSLAPPKAEQRPRKQPRRTRHTKTEGQTQTAPPTTTEAPPPATPVPPPPTVTDDHGGDNSGSGSSDSGGGSDDNSGRGGGEDD